MLHDRFQSASAFMASNKKLSLPTATKLALYADYKLATEGLCTQSRPSLIEFEKSAKWKAWKETGDRYTQELAQSSSSDDDIAQISLTTKAMIAYIQRVEEGNWGWSFNPSASGSAAIENHLMNSAGNFSSTGDEDLDELEAYLGVDPDEVSAEELLARPYVPNKDQIEGATMTAAGISTMAPVEDEITGDDVFETSKSGSTEAMRTALDANPDLVSVKDDMGMTMLHWVCDRGNVEKAMLLITKYHADVNVQDVDGSTPLHYAYLSGWPQVIAYLRSVPSIDLTIKDSSGMTAEECQE
ncbi:hypothetical protein BGZ74_004005 [Mortierella antarctica]|nr:hypothetical protein BGZ74_004005 [Mortierella antarctica]